MKHLRTRQSMVEFALVFPLLLLLVLGTIETARLFQAYITVQHAAREGARYAITGRSITGAVQDRPQSIVEVTRRALAGLPLYPRTDTPARESSTIPYDADVELIPQDAVDPNTRPKPFQPEPITVRVYYNHKVWFPVQFNILGRTVSLLPPLIPIQGEATMIVERLDKITPLPEGTLTFTPAPTLTDVGGGGGNGGGGGSGGSPTPTFTPTPTYTPTPAGTLPPWPTFTPTFTATFTPSPTPWVTPTATPYACNAMSGSLEVKDDKIRGKSITNNGGQALILIRFQLIWPASNYTGGLREIKIQNTKIWSTATPLRNPPVGLTFTGNQNARTWPVGASKNIEFKFSKKGLPNPAVEGDYVLTLVFLDENNVECEITLQQP